MFAGEWKVDSDRSVCTGFPFLAMKTFGTRSRKWLYNSVKVKVKVTQSCLTLCDPMDLVHGINSPGHNTGVGSLSLLQGHLPNPGIKPRSPTLQVDSLPAEPQGKPKNTGAGSLSLLQWIFLTQELNQGLEGTQCH